MQSIHVGHICEIKICPEVENIILPWKPFGYLHQELGPHILINPLVDEVHLWIQAEIWA